MSNDNFTSKNGILKDESRVSCENFITKSFVFYLCTGVSVVLLRLDTWFYQMMENENIKASFFNGF